MVDLIVKNIPQDLNINIPNDNNNTIMIIIVIIRVMILVISLYNCNMSNFSKKSNYNNKSNYSSNKYYINNSSNSNCNTIWEKKLTEIWSLIHRMHNVKWLVYDS